jgi:tetratricopeptide (TPR) repeat protein
MNMRKILAAVLVCGLTSAVILGCSASRSAVYSDSPAAAAPSVSAKDSRADEVPGPLAGAPGSAAASRIIGAATGGAAPGAREPATWKRAAARPNATRLKVGDSEELPLKAVQISVRVDGFRARVLLDCFYHNDRGRQLEGTFQLRLPDGASPYYLAFGNTAYSARDVAAGRAGVLAKSDGEKAFEPGEIIRVRRDGWNSVMEARMVPREKAGAAYRETVHRRVDPAIMEWSGAGVFSARVYPLMPDQVSRVVVGYDLDLAAVGDELELCLGLPAKVANCVVDLDVATPRGITARVTPEAFPAAAVGREPYRLVNPKAESITLRLARKGDLCLAGSDPAGAFFAAELRPELPANSGALAARPAVFMLDTSLSSAPDKFNAYLKIMAAILEANRDGLKEFAVLAFDVSPRWWRQGWTANTAENAAALRQWAEGLSLEGATDLAAALREAAAPSWLADQGAAPACDIFLLGDGAATWGEVEPAALAESLRRGGGQRPLFAYRTGLAGSETQVLEILARASGGAVFAVTGEADVASAARAHRARPWRLGAVKLPGASDLLLAGRPESVFPGQRLLLVGRGRPAEGAECELEVEQAGVRRTVKARVASVLESPLAPRIYGQAAVGQIEELLPANEAAARHYAAHFRVTGQSCSLLMLESERDYARFNLAPADDTAAVREITAAGLVAAAPAPAAGREAGTSAKAAFLAMIARLEKTQGGGLALPPALREILAALPAGDFVVEPERLAPRCLSRAGWPRSYAKALAAEEPGYEAVWDEAARRAKAFGPADALRAASSLVESRPGDQVQARDVGFSALEWNLAGHAYHLFRAQAAARPLDPQNYRAMALALHELGRADLALACYELALAGRWDARFGEYRRIVALDYLRLLRALDGGKLAGSTAKLARDRLRELGPVHDLGEVDLVVALTWNTDATDVDLHVTEPSGETCYYQHNRTRRGGSLSADVTTGYGPEMYTIKRADAGDYRVRAHYYASDRNRTSARTRVYATIVTGWGTEREQTWRRTALLDGAGRLQDVAMVKLEGKSGVKK